ncbi:MAG: PASTA domain-containing protein [Bacteroidetes bacterium]|nr:PASTA domain-containing protein [Bacteroidota bacterium]
MLKNWIFNGLLGIVAGAILLWLIFGWMKWYTHHGTAVEVPNLKGLVYESAIEKLEDAGLRFEINDSVYNADFKKDAVVEQDPFPGDKVKPNRIIYITVNSLGKPRVKMPRLTDQSFTLAKALLKNAGLVLGNVEYKFDEIGHNLVIAQRTGGQEVPPGKLLEKGTVVDLVVATNRKNVAPDNNGEESIPEDPAPGEGPELNEKPQAKENQKAKSSATASGQRRKKSNTAEN